MTLERVVAAWDRFWFRPVSALSLGVMRASLGLLLVLSHLHLGGDLDLLFGRDGPIPPEAAAGTLPWPRLNVLDGLSGDSIRVAWVAGFVPLVLFAVGWNARTMAVASLVVAVLLYHRNPFYQHGGDRVMRLATLSLALAPCGAALSVDAWLAAARAAARGEGASRALVPAVAHRLLQVQLAVIYTHSGLVKASGRAWREGTALYYALSDGQYQRAPWLVDPFLATGAGRWFTRIGTWTTLLWESGFAVLVLLPWTRRPALLLGLLFHLGIFLGVNVGSFTFVMAWCYLAWVRPEWFDLVAERFGGRRRGRADENGHPEIQGPPS